MESYENLNGFLLKKEDKRLMHIIMPELFLDNARSSELTDSYLIYFLQDELNGLLHSFVNGGFSNIGYVIYPLSKGVSHENVAKLKKLKKLINLLSMRGFDFSESLKQFYGNYDSKKFSLILSKLYQDFSRIEKGKHTPLVKNQCKSFNIDDYKKSDLSYLNPLNELNNYANKELKSHAKGVYLHGSMATKDYIKGWSDVDTVTIISKSTINNAKSLLKLRDMIYRMRYFFYKIDPLQHHGTIAVSEYDIDCYPNAYFSVEIFKYARSLLENDTKIKFRVRDSSHNAIKRLFWFVSYFRKLKLAKNCSMSSYDMKELLHSVALFPAVYLQTKGVFVYKKFSFGIAKKDFKKDLWKPVDDVSSLRLSWKKYYTMPLINLFKMNPLFYHRLNFRIVDTIKSVNKTNNIDAKSIIDGMYGLSEEAWSRVAKNAE